MAISLKTGGAWGSVVIADVTVTLVGTPAAGDRYFMWVVWKAFGTTCQIVTPQAWTKITEYTDGSVASGSGLGSVKVACFYRDWQSGDGNPVVDFSVAPTVGSTCLQLWQKGAGETWATPLFQTAPWPVTSAAQTIAATSGAITVPDSSVVMAMIGLRDNNATFTRGATTGIDVASGITWNGNYVEHPAAHQDTTTGDDGSYDIGHRFVTTGAAGAALRVTATIAVAQTGAILWVVQGLTAAALPRRFIRNRMSVPVRRKAFY